MRTVDGPYKLLLIDDDSRFFTVLEDNLREIHSLSATLELETDSTRAIEILARNDYRVAFVTSSFRSFTAPEFIANARQRGCEEPIILLTSSGSIAIDVEGLRAGASDYLSIPGLTPERLERAIRHVLLRRRTDQEIRERLRVDKIITAMAMRFINLPAEETDAQILGSLRDLGETSRVERITVFLRDLKAGTVSLRHEWCAPGIRSAPAFNRDVPFSEVTWLADQLTAAGFIQVSDGKEIPPEATGLLEMLRARQVKSFLLAPLMCGGQLLGALSLASLTQPRSWSLDSIRLIKIGAQILANALEQRRIQEALRQSEQRYREVVEGLGEGIIVCDGSDVILQVNTRMADIAGYTVGEMVGKFAYDLLSVPGEEEQLRERTRRRRNGISESYEMRLRKKDGSLFWAAVNATPLADAAGQFSASLGAITDISFRKEAEETLRQQQQFLRLVIDTTPNLIYVKDSECRVVLANRAFAEFYRSSPDALLGKSDLEIHPEHDQAQHFYDECKLVLESGQTKIIDQLMMHDPFTGKERWHHVIRQPFVAPDGRSMQLLTVATDITERRHAEQEALRLERQLLQSQKLEAIGQLAAGIAHDLNNALGAVVGHLQLLQLSADLPGSAKGSVEIALGGCERALSLIEQLLGFSRQGKYNLTQISIQRAVRETVEFLGKIIEKHIRLSYDGVRDELYVRADPGQLQQALTNLILNAKQSMPEGGAIRFQFEVKAVAHPEHFNSRASAGEYVVVSIEDTGVGIPEELRHRIFEPFFTTKEQEQGSGLGLSMVYGIMQNHGGWVEVASTRGSGSRFSLYFPRAQGAVMSTTEKPASIELASGLVLVIDDESILVDLTKRFLELAGIATVGFTSGQEALSWYESHFREVDLVILDMKMARMDGKECFDSIRQINPDARVAILSGYVQDAAAQDLLSRGALRFFHKPLKYPELVKWVSAVLGKAEQVAH